MADSSNIRDLVKPQPQSLALATGTMTGQCEPATLKQGKSELGACLTLVSPSGLTTDDRKEWLAVAMKTLSGIPADLLADGCATARKRCRFPSEIVPTILEEVEQRWRWRREDAMRSMPSPVLIASSEPDLDLVDPADVAKLLASLSSGNA